MSLSRTRPHLKTLDEIEHDCIPGLLEPMQKIAELAGSGELIEALKHADERCVREINAALDERATLTGELG